MDSYIQQLEPVMTLVMLPSTPMWQIPKERCIFKIIAARTCHNIVIVIKKNENKIKLIKQKKKIKQKIKM